MKAISIKQPWAWAIIHAGKNVENRSWPCKYRGPLLIHAGKTFDRFGYAWMIENKGLLGISDMPSLGFPETYFKRGGIIGQVDMVACVKKFASKWFFGEYGFVFDNQKPLRFYPCRGHLGIFEVNYATRANVRLGVKDGRALNCGCKGFYEVFGVHRPGCRNNPC